MNNRTETVLTGLAHIPTRGFGKFICCFFGLTFCCFFNALLAQNHAIIPEPKQMVENRGTFTLNEDIKIYYNRQEMSPMVDYTLGIVKSLTDLSLTSTTKSPKHNNGVIRLLIDTNVKTDKEGYFLEILPSQINLKSPTP